MADEPPPTPDPTAPAARALGRTGCNFVGGFFAAGLLGMALAFGLAGGNNPGWMFPAVLFAPVVIYLVIWTAFGLPAVVRRMRELARNAPSPESMAAAARGEGVEVGGRPDADEPDEPDDTPTVVEVETTPGKVLAHRLPRSGMPPGCQFGCAVLVACFWNGIVGVFVYQLARKWGQGGAFRWVEAAFLVPFALVGLVMIVYALHSGLRWVVAGLVGAVEVELAAHPLAPGGTARLHVAQRGLFPLARVFVRLVCTEQATYVAGTSKSTATKEVAERVVSDPDQRADGSGLPLEAALAVPADAMHSFHAPNNQINWTLRVAGRVLGLPFSEEYGLTVGPGEPGA
jgi:hypothetical protein